VKKTIAKGNKIYSLFEQSYQEVIPLEIQEIGVGLVWSGLFDEVTTGEVDDKRRVLVTKYEEKEFKNLVQKAITVETLKELTNNILAEKDTFTKMLGLKGAGIPKVTEEVVGNKVESLDKT